MSLPNSPLRVANNAAERNVNVIAFAIRKQMPHHGNALRAFSKRDQSSPEG
jgi:hypothetical protein